ncbi:MAG: hypothetical protein GM44_2410, partial [actinobacterium acAMD-2]
MSKRTPGRSGAAAGSGDDAALDLDATDFAGFDAEDDETETQTETGALSAAELEAQADALLAAADTVEPEAPGDFDDAGIFDEDPADAEEVLRQLWIDFKATEEQGLRDRLILHYSPLVKYVAGRVGVGLPPNIEQSDLVSYGIFGLIDAITKFDLAREIKFETYAITRIRGAIIDELRSIDWIPRSVRAKAKSV